MTPSATHYSRPLLRRFTSGADEALLLGFRHWHKLKQKGGRKFTRNLLLLPLALLISVALPSTSTHAASKVSDVPAPPCSTGTALPSISTPLPTNSPQWVSTYPYCGLLACQTDEVLLPTEVAATCRSLHDSEPLRGTVTLALWLILAMLTALTLLIGLRERL